MKKQSFNVLESDKQVQKILEDDSNDIGTMWTSKLHHNTLSTIFIPEILPDDWYLTDPVELVNLVLNYLIYPVLNKDVDFYEYRSIVNEYLKTVFTSSQDHVYDSSLKALMDIGYKI